VLALIDPPARHRHDCAVHSALRHRAVTARQLGDRGLRSEDGADVLQGMGAVENQHSTDSSSSSARLNEGAVENEHSTDVKSTTSSSASVYEGY
jgi:hypothetical protein